MSTTEISEINYFNKNLYCSGKCLALLSALMVIAVCHDSNVPLCRTFAWSMTLHLAKSNAWSLSHACLAMLEPTLHFLTFLICFFFLVSNDMPVSSMYFHEQSAQLI